MSLAFFVVAFILFMLAPLLMMLLVGFGMYGVERWGKRRRGRAKVVTGGTAVPPAQRAIGLARDVNPDSNPFGFGGISGEDL